MILKRAHMAVAAWPGVVLSTFLMFNTTAARAADECAASLHKQGMAPEAAAQFDKGTAAMSAGQYDAAYASWKPLAEQGNCQAQFNLGTLYLKGRGVAQDLPTAIQWFQQAAQQGNAHAQYNLAESYRVGTGIAKDPKLAASWNTKAAEQGVAMAQSIEALRYANGDGVERDRAKALTYYQKAARQGDLLAQYNLGIMYALGDGVPRDPVLAGFYVTRAALSGYESARKAAPGIAAKLSAEQKAQTKKLLGSWKTGDELPLPSAPGNDKSP
jgi:TPR repeat protein